MEEGCVVVVVADVHGWGGGVEIVAGESHYSRQYVSYWNAFFLIT